ncbi:pilus assembly protein [Geomonas agri]|uniref:pilus assembly protein n=1 Tax=Geomonas agri TaxID=2873702 RepID=UPI001CD4FD27|nr:pilus assembly protein PilY [Geomonas agri]
MRNLKKAFVTLISGLAFLFALQPLTAGADALSWSGEQYCVKPPFVAGNIPPNLLLMIDNSSSMYDLAYVDKGNANRQPYYCYDETYSNANTYSGYFETTDSAGSDIYYQYRAATDDFVKVTGTFPFGCGSVPANTKIFPNTMCIEFTKPKTLTSFVAKGNYLNWLTASKFDVEKKILTGGKYDATTNTSNAPGLVAESRGCVGQGYVKDADATNFVDYTGDASNNLNVSLGVTFTITGPLNPNNKAAYSTGGQTYINLFSGDQPYDAGKCQAAVNAIQNASGTGQVTSAVQDCLTSTTPPVGTCSIMDVDPATGLPVAHSCIDTYPPATPNCQPTYVAAHCQGNNVACTTNTDCNVTGGSACTAGKVGRLCGVDSDCDVKTCSVNGSACTGASDCYKAPTPGVCSKGTTPSGGCVVDSDCKTKNAACTGYNAGYNYGTCGVSTAGTCTATASSYQGPCVPATGGNLGVCQFSPHDTLVKTNVLFASSMQTCWALRKNNTQPGNDEYNAIIKNCPILYAGYKSCSNNSLQACTANADCGTGNTCVSGPAAIGPGNSGLLCSMNYEGQFFTNTSGTTWVVASSLPSPTPTACTSSDTVKDCMLKVNAAFCSDMSAPPVTDPTDSPSTTVTTDNLPAILSGVGVDAQLGGVIASMRAKVANSTQPSGIIQDFAHKIRLGTMTFNQFGSASETSLGGVGSQKTCSNNPQQSCWQNIDCGSGNTCSTTSTVNYDGGSIAYPIGLGYCSTMSTTACTSDGQCSYPNTCLNGFCGTKSSTVCTTSLTCTGSSQACISNGAGDHVSGFSLVSSIDAIRANAWTPFAETFYNALGYFAAVPQANSTFKSRVTGAATGLTGLRLNAVNTTSTTFKNATDPSVSVPSDAHPIDFNEVLNPSEYRCQQNYILLITDGTSTADRNSSVHTLAGLYASQAGTTAGYCPDNSNGVNYGGTSDLPIMAWIGKRHNLATFSTSSVTPLYCSSTTTKACSADADCPTGETCTNAHYPRDYVSTFVVLNGADNGVSGLCNTTTLLTNTAVNGGTKQLYQASDYNGLKDALTTIFQNIAAKASSGTAASILSNSEGSGANILQAVFYPKKVFEAQTSSNWIGEMQNLWYYVDPQISRSTIREDTNGDKQLDLIADSVVSFRFDSTDNTTYAYVSQDTNGDGVGDTAEVKEDTDLVKSIWRAGKQLWARDLSASPRKIFTSIDGTSLIDFSSSTFLGTANTDNSATLAPYLNVSAGEATRLINYVHGVDQPDQTGFLSYRSRKVKIKDPVTNVVSSAQEWRLGDIISSTPRIQSTGKLNTYNLAAPSGYGDASYASFIASYEYQHRGMVYVGGNDGMMHSFKLGLLDVSASGTHKATLSGTGLGEEQWAYIPKQALPYLKYYGDPDYNHIYYVDGATVLFDASIGTTTNTGTCPDGATYYDCPKQTYVVNSSNQLDTSKNTWRTVLISGMGIGGASAKTCATGSECVQTPLAADPGDATKALGYSSYFALDITNPDAPSLMWEFNDPAMVPAPTGPAMGFATTGPAVIRVGPRDKNGNWYVVFASGPTGQIDTNSNQFKGQSNQTLKFFIVDLRTGALLRTIDTGIANAFAGSLLGGPIDADRWNSYANGDYQDDAIFVGYTKKNTSTNTWTDGGVIRITTKESNNVNNWTWSYVVQDTGPVVTAISRLQDRKNKNLWLYFGSGRYYYRAGTDIDDFSSQRSIYGIKDPCYNTDALPGNVYDKNCTATVTSGITDQSTSISSTVGAGGWKIDLDLSSNGFGAERVVTDAVALTNGTIFLTSFQPTADPCGFGGNSFLWALGYDTGGRPSDAALAGKALIQLSTGEFKEVDLAQAFGSGAARLMRRSGVPMTGKPPADAFPIVSKSGNKPVKKIMHIQER